MIGKTLSRSGGVERVTGALRYTADVRFDHVLQIRLLHLNCARAKILSVDTSDAARVPGVHSIVTAEDLPQPMPRCGPAYSDRPLIAVGETKFFGEPVVAIAA